MLTTILKTVNDAVQILARLLAFVAGIVIAIICWPLIKITWLLTTILWWPSLGLSWLGGRALMFAMDMDPVKTVKQVNLRHEAERVRKLIQEALKEEAEEEERKAKDSENTDDPS